MMENVAYALKKLHIIKKIAPDAVFNWLDITKDKTALNALNISLSDALKELHVQDTQGKILKGIDAFVVIWRNLPKFKYLAWFISLPCIKQIAQFCYLKFAAWRFKKSAHCKIIDKTKGHN